MSRGVFSNDECMMVSDFSIIYTSAIQHFKRAGIGAELRMIMKTRNKPGNSSIYILRNVLTAGTRVGDQLRFVKTLSNIESGFRRVIVSDIGLFLQGC